MTEVVEKKKRGPRIGWKLRNPAPPVVEAQNGHSGIDAYFHADDSRILDRYRNLPVEQVLFELGRLRKIADLVISVANQRAVPDESKCWICKKVMRPGEKVAMMYVNRDPESGIQTSHPICSILCVREHNKKRMGWQGGAAIPDQGVEARDGEKGKSVLTNAS